MREAEALGRSAGESPAPSGAEIVARSLEGPWSRRLLLAAVLVWFGFLVLVPIGALVQAALKDGFAPFLKSLDTPAARHAFWLTLWITVVSVLVNTVFGTILALVLARQRFIGRTLLSGFVDLPLAVSPVVAGFMFIILFGPGGWLGRWFEAGGIRIVFALPGMVLVTIFVTIPFVAREVVPVLMECSVDQEQAARTLGANDWQTFWRVTLPSIRWGVAYGVTLTTARALGEFGAILVVSGSIIGKTQTATIHIHQEFTDFHYQGAFSASLVLAAASFLMLVAMELLKRRAESGRA